MMKVDVVKMNLPRFMCTGSNYNDSGAGSHPVKQEGREQKMPQMIDPELSLDSVCRFLPVKGDKTCIID